MSEVLRAWRQADRRFKTAAALLLAALIADVAIAAVASHRIDVLFRTYTLTTLLAAAVFYIFFMPLTMLIIQRDMHRGRADAADLATAVTLMHVTITNVIKLATVYQ